MLGTVTRAEGETQPSVQATDHPETLLRSKQGGE